MSRLAAACDNCPGSIVIDATGWGHYVCEDCGCCPEQLTPEESRLRDAYLLLVVLWGLVIKAICVLT